MSPWANARKPLRYVAASSPHCRRRHHPADGLQSTQAATPSSGKGRTHSRSSTETSARDIAIMYYQTDETLR